MSEKYHNPQPLVSICIPVFNGEKTIRKTIDSIINQTYKNLEIIIVDNCSMDSTVAIVQEFNDSRVQLIQNAIHLPVGEYNWNRCFQYVHGEFIALFHADDVYLPQMVSQQIETFKNFPSVGGIFTRGNIINEHDEIIGEVLLPPAIKTGEPFMYFQLLPSILENGDFLLCPSAMIRSDLYKKLSPFRYDRFGSASDLDMWLRMTKCAPGLILNDKLMNYRISRTQGTHVLNHGRTHEADFFRVMDSHIAQNNETDAILIKSMNKYNISKFGDQIHCIRNSLVKKDLKEFTRQIKQVLWIRYLKILMRNPQLINFQFLKQELL
jgi:glycosyltransferase involved in cell wall biosynthesis